jgi:hypothetical protein
MDYGPKNSISMGYTLRKVIFPGAMKIEILLQIVIKGTSRWTWRL